VVDVLEKAIECGVHEALQLPFRREFDLEIPTPLTGVLQETLRTVGLERGLPTQPGFEVCLVLRRRKPPARMLPNEEEVLIPRPTVSWIRRGMIPQETQLPGHEGAHFSGNLLQAVGNIAEVRQRLQQQRHAAAVGLATAGQDQLQVGWREQEVLNQFLVAVGQLELGVGAAHGGSPRLRWVAVTISRNGENRHL
jgi:hypothetical protein